MRKHRILVQDTFLRFFKQDEKILQPKAWLYKNTSKSFVFHILRKNGRLQRTTDEEQLDFLDSFNRTTESILVKNLEKKEAVDRVSHAISLLPKESKELITLKFDQQKSYNEISKNYRIKCE